MNESKTRLDVVVADIQMPFWSIVILMMKWAIAAIPAAIILTTIIVGGTAIVGGVIASLTPVSQVAQQAPIINVPYVSKSKVPDRCKGSSEEAKCIERELSLKNETPEEMSIRQKNLDDVRTKNLESVK